MATRVEYEFDPFELVNIDKAMLKPSDIKSAVDEVGDFVYSRVRKNTSQQVSSVTGDAFEKLSKDYAKLKKKQVGNALANLVLSGDMMDSLKVIRRAAKLTLTVGANEQGKADGHNNHSQESKLPERKFIPSESLGETFSPDILSGITEIISKYVDDSSSGSNSDTLNGIVDRGLVVQLQSIVDDTTDG